MDTPHNLFHNEEPLTTSQSQRVPHCIVSQNPSIVLKPEPKYCFHPKFISINIKKKRKRSNLEPKRPFELSHWGRFKDAMSFHSKKAFRNRRPFAIHRGPEECLFLSIDFCTDTVLAMYYFQPSTPCCLISALSIDKAYEALGNYFFRTTQFFEFSLIAWPWSLDWFTMSACTATQVDWDELIALPEKRFITSRVWTFVTEMVPSWVHHLYL